MLDRKSCFERHHRSYMLPRHSLSLNAGYYITSDMGGESSIIITRVSKSHIGQSRLLSTITWGEPMIVTKSDGAQRHVEL